jgi:hypothetical protein
MLLRNMPEPSNPDARRARDEIRELLETAAMQQAESSASRRREPASERLVEPSRQERERPWFIPSLPGEIGRRLSLSTSPTTVNLETPVATSSSAARAKTVMVWLEVTVCTEASATTAQKIIALHPSLRALGSSVRLSAK